jgi:hypothetical protein
MTEVSDETGLIGLMSIERVARPAPPVFAVRSAIGVDAPPEEVWKQEGSKEPFARLGISAKETWYRLSHARRNQRSRCGGRSGVACSPPGRL